MVENRHLRSYGLRTVGAVSIADTEEAGRLLTQRREIDLKRYAASRCC